MTNQAISGKAKAQADLDAAIENIVDCSLPGQRTLIRAYCKYLIACARMVQIESDIECAKKVKL